MAAQVKLEALVDEDVDRRLQAIAAARGIDKAELVANVLHDYAPVGSDETAADYAAFVEVGLKDWREGRLIEHDDVVARINKILAE